MNNMIDERKFVIRAICFIIGTGLFCGGLALTTGSGAAGIVLFTFLGLSVAVLIAVQWITFKLVMSISEKLRKLEKENSQKQ